MWLADGPVRCDGGTNFCPGRGVSRGENITFAKRYDDLVVQPAFDGIQADTDANSAASDAAQATADGAQTTADVLGDRVDAFGRSVPLLQWSNWATGPVGNGPSGVAFDGTNIWVTNRFDGTVTRINAATAVVVGGPITVGDSPVGVAFDGTNIWVTNDFDGTVSKIPVG